VRKNLTTATVLSLLLIITILSSKLINQTVAALNQSTNSASTMTIPKNTSGLLIPVIANDTIITDNDLMGLNVSSIETKVRIINISGTDSHAGITWTNGNSTYYVFLRPAKSTVSIFAKPMGEFLFAKVFPHLSMDTQYSLKIDFDQNSISVLLNDLLLFRVPQHPDNLHVSKIGLKVFNSTAEFEPPKIVKSQPSNRLTRVSAN